MTVLFESHPEMYHRRAPVKSQPTVKAPPRMSVEQLKERQKKMESLYVVKNSASPLLQRIQEATGCIEGKEYLYLQDQLERCHITLDNIEANGDEEVRKKRKSIAVFVSSILSMLDVKAGKVCDEDKIDKDLTTNDQEADGMNDNCEDSEINNESEQKREDDIEIKIEHETNENNIQVIPTANESETSCQNEVTRNNESHEPIAHEEEKNQNIKENILDNSRIRMQAFDNSINLIVDVRHMAKDDLKVRFEDDELIVTGRRGGQRVMMRKTVPSDCMFSRAVSQLCSDGFMVVKVPRTRNLHPFQIRRQPFWF